MAELPLIGIFLKSMLPVPEFEAPGGVQASDWIDTARQRVPDRCRRAGRKGCWPCEAKAKWHS